MSLITETGVAVIITSSLTGITALIIAIKKNVISCSCMGCKCVQTTNDVNNNPNSGRSETTKKVDNLTENVNRITFMLDSMKHKLTPRKTEIKAQQQTEEKTEDKTVEKTDTNVNLRKTKSSIN